MQIELPDDLSQRVIQRTKRTEGLTEVEIIRKGLDALDWQDNERDAIQEGLNDMNAGRVQKFDDFDREFRQHNGIAPNG